MAPETCSASWLDEHKFWYEKSNNAYIRFNAALEAGDDVKMDIAEKQMDIYRRRMKAVVPASVEDEWRKKKEAEIEAAMNE